MVARSLRMPLEAVLFPLVLITAWALYGTSHWLEARRIERVADGSVGVLPDGNAVRVLSLGFERAVADLFWVRTVYYIGDESASAAKWPGAERLANLVTDTDPHFDSAYVLMASVLGTLRGDPDAAIRVLEKGAAVSSYWRIHFMLGFQYFMEKQDYARGAQSLQRAYDLGGPKYLLFLVSRLYTSAGDPNTAMGLLEVRLKNEEAPQVRAALEKRYADIWIHRDLGLIDDAIEKFRVARKASPRAVSDLVAAGLLPKPPHDPKGGEYFISEGKAATRLEYDELKVNLPRSPRGE
jgi:tetratricopeptide (TPR) repeat protein